MTIAWPKVDLTSFQIKLLAAGLMLIDHVGAIFFPDVSGFRIIGRLSFPLFAWLLGQGEAHTRHFWRYFWRLLGMAFISQPFFHRAFDTDGWWELNILFTLAVGLIGLRGRRWFPKAAIWLWVGLALLAEALGMDYGAYGVGAIALLRHYQLSLKWWGSWGLLHLLLGSYHQIPALVAPFIVQGYGGQRGARARWFYSFYPGHLAVLWLLHEWLMSRAVG